MILYRLITAIPRYILILLFKIKYPKVKFLFTGRYNKIPKIYSEEGQDFIFFTILYNYLRQNKINNLAFLDIGANHPFFNSNSAIIDNTMPIKVLAFDPLIKYKELWEKERPNAIFINKAIGETAGIITLSVPINEPDSFSAVIGGMKKKSNNHVTIDVEMISINDIINKYNDLNFIAASIDVEGFELNVLKGMDLHKNRIGILIIENNSESLLGNKDIRDFLTFNGYVYVARLGFYDDIFISKELYRNFIPSLSFLGIK